MAGASRLKQFTTVPAIGPVEQSGSHMNVMQDTQETLLQIYSLSQLSAFIGVAIVIASQHVSASRGHHQVSTI
jgi:hypothetical protein